jgi:hypothetical protein
MYRRWSNASLLIGRDMLVNRFVVRLCWGFIDGAPLGSWPWRHIYEWQPRWPVRLWRSFDGALFIEYGFGARRRIQQLTRF